LINPPLYATIQGCVVGVLYSTAGRRDVHPSYASIGTKTTCVVLENPIAIETAVA